MLRTNRVRADTTVIASEPCAIRRIRGLLAKAGSPDRLALGDGSALAGGAVRALTHTWNGTRRLHV